MLLPLRSILVSAGQLEILLGKGGARVVRSISRQISADVARCSRFVLHLFHENLYPCPSQQRRPGVSRKSQEIYRLLGIGTRPPRATAGPAGIEAHAERA